MIRTLWRQAGASAFALAISAAATPLHGEGFTNDQVRELLNELRLIRQALERAPAPAAAPAPQPMPQQAPQDDRAALQLAPGELSLGREDAPLVMVEYTDYQCPFCQQFHNATWPELKKNYIDTGRLRFVSRDFPLDFHENARRAAMAAHCAAEQGKFWELRHVMIVNASRLQPDRLPAYAREVGLDVASFDKCVESARHADRITKSYGDGLAAGVSGTPSFFLGRVKGDRLEGVRIVGALPYGAFDARIRQMLDTPAR